MEEREPWGDAFKTALVEGYGFEDNFVQMGYNYACPFEPGYTYTTLFSCELGMSEIRTSIKPLQILPNPVLNTLQINFPEQNIGSAFGYSIVDCSGKEVFRGKSSVNNTIDVSGIKKGLYLLRVTDYQNNVFQNKFLKQ